MSRIMQVIDKKTDFSRGTVDLKLYQTNFVGLTKVITDVHGQTVANAVSGQNVGYQFFHDLNLKQLAVRDYVDTYKPKYNAEISAKKTTVTNLIDFNYNWKSCVDYRSQIVSGDKADYRLFQKVVNAEKELYDYRLYVSDHVKRNCDILADWSKEKKYGSNVDYLSGDLVEMRGTSNFTYTVTAPEYLKIYKLNESRSDFYQPRISNLSAVPVGNTAIITVKCNQNNCVITYSVTRYPLESENDDGYFTSVKLVSVTGIYEGVRSSAKPEKLFGKKSPHFTKTDGNYDLNFFKTRRLI